MQWPYITFLFVDGVKNPFGSPAPRGHSSQEYMVFLLKTYDGRPLAPYSGRTRTVFFQELTESMPCLIGSCPREKLFPPLDPSVVGWLHSYANMPLSRPRQWIRHQRSPSSGGPWKKILRLLWPKVKSSPLGITAPDSALRSFYNIT